jgi:hypothetical protein
MPGRPLHERHDMIGTLARLDRRVVPVLQRGARGLAAAGGSPWRALAHAEDRWAPALVDTAVRAWRFGILLGAVLILLASAVHLQRYPELRDQRVADQRAAQEQRVGVPGSGPTGALAGGAQAVGPRRDQRLASYVAERGAALAALPDGERVTAVVSFDDYRTPEAIDGLLPEGVEVRLAQYRVPAEGERPLETEVVAGDIEASIDRVVEQTIGPIIDEIGEVRRLIESDTVDDPAFADDLQRRLSELEAVRNLLDTGHRIVFAVVVEGPVEGLRALADRDGVRLVDPAPGETDIDRSAFYGLLPEDREHASYGATP